MRKKLLVSLRTVYLRGVNHGRSQFGRCSLASGGVLFPFSYQEGLLLLNNSFEQRFFSTRYSISLTNSNLFVLSSRYRVSNTLGKTLCDDHRPKMQGRIVVYSIVGCPHCIRSKGYLEERGLTYVDVNLDAHASARTWVVEKTGRKTVPQIFFNEVHVGGNDDLQKLTEDELKELVTKVTDNEVPEGSQFIPEATEDTSQAEDESAVLKCELDEYAKLKEELKASGIIKDHGWLFKTQKNSFTGKDAVDWLVSSKQLTREAAVTMMADLLQHHFGKGVKNTTEFRDDGTFYRLLEDDDSNALNAGVTSDCEPRPASELGEDLRRLILSIYNKHLSADGKKVNYTAIGDEPDFKKYIEKTAELKRVQIEDATREEKLAFFINIYNALVIHAFVKIGPPKNLWQRYKFFNTVSYIIGGYQYSLNEIENGILRSNRKAIGAFTRPFGKSDPRMKVALETPESRVHFALVCGAKSCPPIKTYAASDVENQLQLAAESFLEGDGVAVDMGKREVKVSQILKWYSQDFGANKEEVLGYIIKHVGEGERKRELQELLNGGHFKLGYLPYDWDLNSH